MDDEVRYTHLTPQDFRERLTAAPVAYLPLGTLEWHGEHLPLGSDGLQSTALFEGLAREAGGIVLPMLFLGPDLHEVHDGKDYYGMDVVGIRQKKPERQYPVQQLTGSAYWAEDALFDGILRRTLRNLARAGFRIVVAHGHGPSTNYICKNADTLGKEFGLKIFQCWNWDNSEAEIEQAKRFQVDHAGANETSIMMAAHGDRVCLDRIDADTWPLGVGGEDPRRFASVQRGQDILDTNIRHYSQRIRDCIADLS